MGVRGPAPKHPALRQRRNTASTKASLPSVEEAARFTVPELPARDGGWHPMVVDWWRSAWQSPMASEWVDVDMRGGLYLLADLHQARWDARDEPAVLVKLAAEIRSQEQRFGLSPIDRRRLQWEIGKGEGPGEAAPRRRTTKRATPRRPVKDPRSVLRIAS
jgi:hypothetical protein